MCDKNVPWFSWIGNIIFILERKCIPCKRRAVFKSRGPGICAGPYECGPWLPSLGDRRKIEPQEISSRLIPCLVVIFTAQLEILVTTLKPLAWFSLISFV